MQRVFAVAAVLVAFALPADALAQELVEDAVNVYRARVVQVLSETVREIPGTTVMASTQTIRAAIVSGPRRGEMLELENDYVQLSEGEVFYLRETIDSISGAAFYSVDGPYRLPTLAVLAALFVLSIFFFGGMQGVRGLLSLIAGLFLIVYVLLPGVVVGYPPALVAILVSSLVIGVGSYVTHGFNRTTTAAVFGMIATIFFTGLLAWASIHFGRLTGFESEEAIYLNFNTGGAIDMAGVLLAGILIGLLGVLYDVAIGQAVAVEELKRAGEHLTSREVYRRALRIGREHTGALVNSLAIAYVGASLPLLLFFYSAGADLMLNMNREIFATEIVRTLVGSIGLVLAVPITTAVSVWFILRSSGVGTVAHGHAHAREDA